MLWREIRAAGFTFCVPASWRSHGPAAGPALDPRTWRSPTEHYYHPASASITWGTGVPPARLETRTEIVVMRGGGELPQRSTTAVPTPSAVRYTELLGGRTAEVSEYSGGYTEVRWRDPAVYLQGVTNSAMLAQLLLAIYRTVRFTPAPPP